MKVNWTEQWEHYAPNFKQGFAHIDLGLYGMKGILRLKPGAGFGDTSHPTTRLVLRLMANYIEGCTVIDIGCGCGILSLAALLNGASRAIGVDIDHEALAHADENSRVNTLDRVSFSKQLPTSLGTEPLIVINMISSEQRKAWEANKPAHSLSCPVIASGILKSERLQYLDEVQKQRGWHLKEEVQEEEWLAFLFEQSEPFCYREK